MSADVLASLDVLRQTRRSRVAAVDAVPDDARTVIPDGFSNHVLWNLGHVVVTERLLVYGLSGLPLGVPDGWVSAFRKGSRPADGEAAAPYDPLRQSALDLPDRTEADYLEGRFETFRSTGRRRAWC